MVNERLEKLLGLYFDEGLTESSKLELEQLLLSCPSAREIFWERAGLNAMLRQLGQQSWGYLYANPVADETPARGVRFPILELPLLARIAVGFSLCTLLAVGLVSIYFGPAQAPHAGMLEQGEGEVRDQTPLSSAPLRETNDLWIATLRGAVDVQWTDSAHAPRVGQPMVARRIQFDSGLVEIQTSRGALLLVEGPADLELVSAMEVSCRKGKLRVDVPPPAYGFVVRTPLVDVVDLGTSFAMQVSGDQVAEVHVIEGIVELLPQSQNVPARRMRQGEAVSVGVTGTLENIPSELGLFPSIADAEARTRTASAQNMEAWKRQRSVITSDPNCLLYFDFEEYSDLGTVLRNSAKHSAKASDGTVIGCKWTDGRWPDKRALDFKNVADRVRFALPAEHRALTCIASIRVDALEHAFNALLMSGDAVVGEIQWQISMRDENVGRMRLGRRPRPGWGFVEDYLSDPIFRREQFGTWLHLAIVWNAEKRTNSQFVDGELISNGVAELSDLTDATFLRTGELEIGNWTPKVGQPIEPIRNFSGRIDEFAIFSRALSPDEIRAHYQLTMTSHTESVARPE